MTKKPLNSLFLNYLIESESNIETNVEKWMEEINSTDQDKISEMSKTFNAHMVFIKACWGELG